MPEMKNPDAPATENQTRYLESLVRARDIGQPIDATLRMLVGMLDAGTLTRAKASELIDAWKTKPFRKIEIKPGYFILDTGIATIYIEVVENRDKTGVYAKRLVNDRWEYDRGLIRDMAAARPMTAEEIANAGHKTGRCLRCQANLTDQDSVTRGYGPTCAKHMGL